MRAYLASPRVHLSLTLGSLLAALGCEPGGSSLGRYAISVWVTTDPEMPLGSVAIARDGSVLGKTDQHGHAALELVGREGDVATLNVRCPEDHTPKSVPLSVPLRSLQSKDRTPSYRVACHPTLRTVVVVVRAERGANLPVLHLGKEVARTDESGTAHVQLKLPPGERFELTLSTVEEGAESLIPQNPTELFVVPDRDEALFFRQQFQRKSRPTARGHRRLPQAF